MRKIVFFLSVSQILSVTPASRFTLSYLQLRLRQSSIGFFLFFRLLLSPRVATGDHYIWRWLMLSEVMERGLKKKENTSWCFSCELESWSHVSTKRYFFHFTHIQENNDTCSVCNFSNIKVKTQYWREKTVKEEHSDFTTQEQKKKVAIAINDRLHAPVSADCILGKNSFFQFFFILQKAQFSGSEKRFSVECFWNRNIECFHGSHTVSRLLNKQQTWGCSSKQKEKWENYQLHRFPWTAAQFSPNT